MPTGWEVEPPLSLSLSLPPPPPHPSRLLYQPLKARVTLQPPAIIVTHMDAQGCSGMLRDVRMQTSHGDSLGIVHRGCNA